MSGAGDLPRGAALVVLGSGGAELARRLARVLPEARVHGPAGVALDAPGEADETFTDIAPHLRRLFAAGVPIVGICAAGILVRALAPLLTDKRNEPPVVAVAGDGAVAVPILGGHRGANRLARAIAAEMSGTAAVTTAGDVHLGLALDDPPPGWRVANPEAAKGVTAALLAGRQVALDIEAGDASWLTASGAPFAEQGHPAVVVTERAVADPGDDLVLHPPLLAVGVGCHQGAQPEHLGDLVADALAAAGLAAGAVACVASLDLKADEAAVHALAHRLGVPARFFTAAELEAVTPRLANPSAKVFRAVGCHGVAEGAALAAAGEGAPLVVEKTGGHGVTCAVARAPVDIDPSRVGRRRGRLAVVGVGPGGGEWRTAEAISAIVEADEVVGYGPYLDLVADLIEGKTLHSTPMTAEVKRVRLALDHAARGAAVALVCSGDAGIYALATLVFELLDKDREPAWKTVEIKVVPGVSALQAAAARIGAPLGHDFCAVSLSDLLTPWEDIERRLGAAAEGDFVVALYNPVSKRRRKQLVAARDILLAARPPETPVVVARNLGREGEAVEIIRLDEMTPERADMRTVLLVGNRHSRIIEHGARAWVYTPRGYAARISPPAGKKPSS